MGTPTDTIRYQYDNHLGSASLELDENAATISYEEYHPFGTSSYRLHRNSTEASLKRYRYVGKERDEETGLYYYGARYYAAWIGRWTATEPLMKMHKGFSANSKSNERQEIIDFFKNNPYNYVENRPIIATDPDGNKIVIKGDKEYVSRVMVDLAYIAATKKGRGMLEQLQKSDTEYTIQDISFGFATSRGAPISYLIGKKGKLNAYDDDSKILKYDPKSSNFNEEGAVFNSVIALGHELRHMYQDDKNQINKVSVNGKKVIKNRGALETDAVQFSNYLRGTFGFGSQRTEYKGCSNFKYVKPEIDETIDPKSLKIDLFYPEQKILSTASPNQDSDNTQLMKTFNVTIEEPITTINFNSYKMENGELEVSQNEYKYRTFDSK